LKDNSKCSDGKTAQTRYLSGLTEALRTVDFGLCSTITSARLRSRHDMLAFRIEVDRTWHFMWDRRAKNLDVQ